MAETDVPWSKLPTDPIGFFRLKPDFGRKDLKRAYGEYIRKYKPEGHPEEFQRIREAYEELERQLRYGVQAELAQTQLNAWNAVSSQRVFATTEGTSSGSSVADDLKNYEKLAAVSNRTPQDFFTLAFSSDIAKPDDPQRFIKWLLMGLKQYPEDPGLASLVKAYLTSDVSNELAPSILLTLAKLVPAEVYYQLTESLWDRLAKETDFGKFTKLLDACESSIVRGNPKAKLSFYIHLLRRCVWQSKSAWFEEKWKFIQSNSAGLRDWEERELDMLTMVREYFVEDRPLIEGSSIRKEIDEMIRSYCEDHWNHAAAKIASVQNEIARNSHAFIDAFPAEKAERDFRVLTLCSVIATDAIEQSGLTLEDGDNAMLERNADQTIADLRAESQATWQKISWIGPKSALTTLGLLVAFPIILLWGLLPNTAMLIIAPIWALVGFVLYKFVLSPTFIEPRNRKKIHRVVAVAYENTWRPRLLRYFQSSHVTPQAALGQLQESAYQIGDGDLVNIVLSYASSDIALHVFLLAQRFVH